MDLSLSLFTPAGVVHTPATLTRAVRRLKALGFGVTLDPSARARHQRFGGDDATRLAAIHRVAEAAPDIAMPTRGGYGCTRLLDAVAWKKIARSVERGTRWVGHSDFTALQLGLLAHTGAASWAGPMAMDDFGRTDEAGGLDDVTVPCFIEAMTGELEAVGFRTEAGFDGLHKTGLLWGGNLAMLCSMIGTKHLPQVKGGILFVEDVGEPLFRVERMLLQLLQAGVIGAQKAVLLGQFSGWKPSPLDRGFKLPTVVQALRERTRVPVLTGLPFGHVATKLTLPVGVPVRLLVDGRNVLLGWDH